MHSKYGKVMALLLSAMLASSVGAGCTSGKNTATGSTTQVAAQTAAQSTSAQTQNASGSGKVTDKPITLSYWCPVDSSCLEFIKGYSENTALKELEKRTGVTINWIHPAVGQENEQFNLMIASNQIPDLVGQAEKYKGGTAVAVKDGLFLDITDKLEKNAPNFWKLMQSNQELKRQMYSDDGVFMGFCMVTSDTFGNATEIVEESPYSGAFIRKDILDELKLSIPETIAEWHDALTAIKKSKNPEVLFASFPAKGVNATTAMFLAAYGIGPDFYQVNGTVKYGRIEDGYKEYLTEMNKWYKEGLIDPEFATRDSKSTLALLSSGKAVATDNQSPSFIKTMKASGYAFTGTPYPVMAKGTQNKWRFKNNLNRGFYTLISKSNKNPIESIKWLDWGYSLEGMALMNYGIDGVDYKGLNKDGCPNYITDYVTADGDATVWTKKRAVFRLHNGTYLKTDKRSNPNRWVTDLEQWRVKWFGGPTDYVLPPVTMTIDENTKYANIMADINTYVNETTVKFIMGTEPLSNFPTYVKNINNMKISQSIEYQQAALKRYNSRK